MDMKKIEEFLIGYCGYKSIEDAIENTPKVNLYPIYGELNLKRKLNIKRWYSAKNNNCKARYNRRREQQKKTGAI